MKKHNLFIEVAIMTVATLIIAASVFFFLIPSHASVSSISGLAIVLSNIIPLKISVLTMILNVTLLIIGFIICGSEFGYKTVYTSILLPLFLMMFEKLLPDYTSLTGDATLDVVCYIFSVSIGLSILFNMNASSGGIDIVAKIINKFTHIDLGLAMSISGMVVALSSAFFYEAKTVILSVLGTYLNGIVLDRFILGQKQRKRVCIVSKEHVDTIKNFIISDLDSGASLYQVQGAHHGHIRTEIITIVDHLKYQKLMNFVSKTDPDAFITVYDVHEIVSKK